MDLEDYLYRIINGYYFIYINDITYKVISPSIHIKQQAHKIYTNIIEDNKFDTSSWITQSNIDNLLLVYNIWNKDLEKELSLQNKNLDKIKIELYENFNNSDIKNNLRALIRNTENQINNLYQKKHYFDYLTLEHYAQSIKSQFLICNTILDSNDRNVFDFKNFDHVNINLVEQILSCIHDNLLDMNTIKKIARHEIWRSFWNISKDKIFEGHIKDWTDEQRSLVNFSKVLDNVREHMEAPTEEIIEDDDALDGWILFQQDKSNKEKQHKQISDKYNLHDKKGNEVFILTNNEEERQSIYNLNDRQANKDIKEMINIAKEKGHVKWTELPHIQRDIKNQIMEMHKK